MTAICGGGASQAKSGFASSIALSASGIAALLNNIPTPWAVPLAGYLGLITYNLSEFCPADPPAVPTITAADIAAALNPFNPVPFEAATAKFQQLVGAYAWYYFCECSSTTTPLPPTAPVAPTGAPTVNPPAIPPSSTPAACYDVSATFDPTDDIFGSSGGSDIADSGHRYSSALGPNVLFATGLNGHSYVIPGGATRAEVRVTTNANGPGSNTFIGQVDFYNSSGASQNNLGIFDGPNGSTNALGILTLLSGATYFSVKFSSGLHANLDVTVRLIFYCGANNNPTPAQPCCPPDSVAQGMLDNILQTVRLIQRQAVPFAYIASSSHVGLSGNGHLAVQGLLGARVLLTSTPANVGVESGDPSVVWEAGWINWSNADGATRREFISASPFISLPPLAGQFTQIGYSLAAGVTATITELVREP